MTRRFGRMLAALLATGGALALPSPAQWQTVATCAATAHHVSVIAEHANGALLTRCVGFDDDALTASDVLQRSGISYQTVNYGALGNAVCQVDGEPATYPPTCFTSSGRYWAFAVRAAGGQWHFASRGISSQSIHDGDAIGFRYQAQGGSGPPGWNAQPCSAAVVVSPPRGTQLPKAVITSSGIGASPSASTVGNVAGVASSPRDTGQNPATHGSTVTATQTRAAFDPGWLAASATAGGLLGLLVVRLVRRRQPQA